MFRRRQTDLAPTPERIPPRAGSRRGRLADAAWETEDRLRLWLGEVGRTSVEIVAWSSEQAAWALRRRLLWPLEDRTATIDRRGRAISFAVVVVLAAGAGVAGLLWAAPNPAHSSAVSESAALSPAPAAPAKSAAAPAPAPATLHGIAPTFRPAAADVAGARLGAARALTASSPAGARAKTAATGADTASSSAAKPSAVNGPPAGPAAIAVARGFAAAFVLYETGRGGGEVRESFAATATPELSRALLHRPPRLPANVTVPQARVVNVVSGPSHGQVYPVSVSLLRVGLTSELRLEMEQPKGKRWRVTNVLG